MDPDSARAILAYWLECGITYLSGDRLAFDGNFREKALPGGVAGFSGTTARAILPPLKAKGEAPVQPSPVSDPPAQPAPLPENRLITAPLPPPRREAALAAMAGEVAQCQRCNLAPTRTKTVFGIGSAEAPVVFVGEGPGEDEDRCGEPFVGPAGRVLDQMIRSIGLSRGQIYIANVVKCRPPGNRNPLPAEMALCQGFLLQQLEIVRPRVIFCLGKVALSALLGLTGTISQARGGYHTWRGIPVIASYHPAFYLRSPSRKAAGWVDLLRLTKLLDQPEARTLPGPGG